MISFQSFIPALFFLVVGSISAPGTEFLLSVAAEPMSRETSAITTPAATEQDVCSQEDMLQMIGDMFGDIGPGKMVWDGYPVPQSECLERINYESDDVATYVNQLSSIFPSCVAVDSSDNNTCKAIQAVINAFVSLKKKGCAPIFRNYLPAWINRYQNSTACVPGSFDLVTKEFSNPNGCNAFAVCDILTTVLTLSANQASTGTCGTTAMFTVLSRAGPVRALQLATELVWTGTTRFLQTAPCPYIYDLFPGVQPLPNAGQSIEDICGATPTGDCLAYYSNFLKSSPSFIQNPGIEFMFTQAFSTSYFRYVTGGCTPEGSQLIKPDFSNKDAVQAYQSTMPYALQYYCRGMVDDDFSCQITDNPDPLVPWKTLNSESASYWLSWPNMTPQSNEQYSNAIDYGIEVTNVNTQRFIEGLLCSINPTGSIPTIEILSQFKQASVPFHPLVPRITESTLNEMCAKASVNEQGVVLVLNAGPLQDKYHSEKPRIPQPCITGEEPYCKAANGNYPFCNHATVLFDCDIPNNIYRIWTWAKVLELPKEVLVANETTGIGGSLCSFMVGKPSDGDQPPFEPTPCETGVCNLFCNISDTSGTDSAATNADAGGMGSTSTATTSISDAGDEPDATNGDVETEVTRPEDGSEETSSGSEASHVITVACCIASSVTSVLLIAM